MPNTHRKYQILTVRITFSTEKTSSDGSEVLKNFYDTHSHFDTISARDRQNCHRYYFAVAHADVRKTGLILPQWAEQTVGCDPHSSSPTSSVFQLSWAAPAKRMKLDMQSDTPLYHHPKIAMFCK